MGMVRLVYVEGVKSASGAKIFLLLCGRVWEMGLTFFNLNGRDYQFLWILFRILRLCELRVEDGLNGLWY